MRNLQLLCMWYDGSFLKLNGKMQMEITLRVVGDDIRVLISSYSETAEDENTTSVVVVNTLRRAIRHSFIAEIMVHYAWYQMLPQIYITTAFHLSITNHAYGFVLALINSISAMISTEWMTGFLL